MYTTGSLLSRPTSLDSEFVVQKNSEIFTSKIPQRQSKTEVITDLHIQLLGRSHCDLLEVKVVGGTESCVLPLRAYWGIFKATSTMIASQTHCPPVSKTYHITVIQRWHLASTWHNFPQKLYTVRLVS